MECVVLHPCTGMSDMVHPMVVWVDGPQPSKLMRQVDLVIPHYAFRFVLLLRLP